jgi:hypothetical protein
MKKLLLVFLVMAMCVSLCACSATIEKEKLVGIWSLEDGTNVVSITFNENNKFSCEYNGAKSEGSYGLFGGDVYLNFPEGKPNLFGEGARSVFTYNGESITLDNLSLLKTSIDKDHLVGIWNGEKDSVGYKFTFTRDGKFTCMKKDVDGKEKKIEGKFEIKAVDNAVSLSFSSTKANPFKSTSFKYEDGNLVIDDVTFTKK